MFNPFRPSFGTSPTVLAGRDSLLHNFQLGLYEGIGSMHRALLISGPRGVGKTVLLNEFEEEAHKHGWVVLRAYANSNLLHTLVHTTIPDTINHLDSSPSSKHRITGISVHALGSISTEHITPVQPQPTLITALRELSNHLRSYGGGIFITLDEIQAAPIDQLSQLATAIQDLMRDGHDIAFAASGLTHGIEEILEHPGTTFLRRAERIELGALDIDSVRTILRDTAQSSGKTFEDEALEYAATSTRGYPYLTQLVGALAWAQSSMERTEPDNSTITFEDIEAIYPQIIYRMGVQIHSIALKRVPDGEINFLRAMAELEKEYGPSIPTHAIASHLGKKNNALSVWRRNLLTRDLILAPQYGAVQFTLPYMGEYLLGQ